MKKQTMNKSTRTGMILLAGIGTLLLANDLAAQETIRRSLRGTSLSAPPPNVTPEQVLSTMRELSGDPSRAEGGRPDPQMEEPGGLGEGPGMEEPGMEEPEMEEPGAGGSDPLMEEPTMEEPGGLGEGPGMEEPGMEEPGAGGSDPLMEEPGMEEPGGGGSDPLMG